MPLEGIYGDVGSGKNLWEQIDLVYLPREIPIYANYRIQLKQAQRIEPEEVFEIFEEDKKQPVKILTTDEAYTWFESRGSGTSDLNTFLSYLMFQSRKRGLNWHSIAQLRATLDLRWRGMEDKLVYAHERHLDMTGNSTDDFGYTLLRALRYVKCKLPYSKGTQFFGGWNTKDVILPPNFEQIKAEIRNNNPENLNKYIDGLAKLIIRNFSINRIELKNGTIKLQCSQDFIRDCLLRLKKDVKYTSLVTGRVKVILQSTGMEER